MKDIFKINTFYAFLSRLSKREKIILYTAIFFISMTILDRLMISPIYSKMRALNKEIRAKESSIKKNLRILARKDIISSEISKFNSFIKQAGSEEETMTALLKEIESLANKSEIYLIDMKPAGLKDMGSTKKYMVNLECEAQMEHLISFMYKIENSDNLLKVERYQIGPKSKESSIARCSIVISQLFIPS